MAEISATLLTSRSSTKRCCSTRSQRPPGKGSSKGEPVKRSPSARVYNQGRASTAPVRHLASGQRKALGQAAAESRFRSYEAKDAGIAGDDAAINCHQRKTVATLSNEGQHVANWALGLSGAIGRGDRRPDANAADPRNWLGGDANPLAAMLEDERLRLAAMPGDALGNALFDGTGFIWSQPIGLATAEIIGVGLTHRNPAFMLRKKPQETAVPDQGSVFDIEEAKADMQAIERLSDRQKAIQGIGLARERP